MLSGEKSPTVRSEPAAVASQPLSRLRVLVVEDHRDSAESLRLLLSLVGHEVRVAYTGTEGVKMATEWGADAVISDIGLPGLDGFAVARALRRHPATAEALLIAVTGYGGEDNRQRALESGFDFHLTKPADPDVLQQLLVGKA